MTSQTYNNKDVLLFPLQIRKQPHRIKCSDQFRVNKQHTDCFEHLYEKNTKPSANVQVSCMLIFLINLRFFYVFYRWEGRSEGTLIECSRDVDVLLTVLPTPDSGREELLNSDPRKQQSMGDMKNNIHKTKSISI